MNLLIITKTFTLDFKMDNPEITLNHTADSDDRKSVKGMKVSLMNKASDIEGKGKKGKKISKTFNRS